jgi:hypothetical protein
MGLIALTSYFAGNIFWYLDTRATDEVMHAFFFYSSRFLMSLTFYVLDVKSSNRLQLQRADRHF